MDYTGILLCTDLDGTLLNSQRVISAENIEAIEYFKAHGGIFTFVTGRMPFFVTDVRDAVKPNAPIGCVNGGGLYDFEKQKYLFQMELSSDILDFIRAIDREVPDVGIQPNTFHHVYFSKENIVMQEFRRLTGLPNLVCPYDAVTEPLAKFVFGFTKESEVAAIRELFATFGLSDRYSFLRSEQTLCEVLPLGVGKDVSIRELPKYLDTKIVKTVAVGDYDNDIPMLRAADVGIAVANACRAAKDAADRITVSNDEHAIAAVIRSL